MMVRVGIPVPGGGLVTAAKALGCPVLFSANAFWRKGRWARLSPDTADLDCALDSAGFVATKLYGGYRWTADRYLDLAGAYPWTWYAAMDFCCEPEIAADRAEVLQRVERTAAAYAGLRRLARDRGMADPMPVLQGWEPADYRRCADLLPHDWPALVGVGSVCRRSTAGVTAIVDALDRHLPAGVRLHLFGVKGETMAELRGHDRIHSVDSMAWDADARYSAKWRSCTVAHRAAVMVDWYARQRRAVDAPGWEWQPQLAGLVA